MCERFDISDRAGAPIALSVLKDFSMSDNKTLTKVIAQSNLKWEPQNSR